MKETVSRFSNRVENYAKYRPHYPEGMVQLLEKTFGISKDLEVTDIGSGTGLSALPFLECGYKVKCVEPNDDMRSFCEKQFARFEKFESVNGTAENTGLRDESVDIIIAGQAFHWFDKNKSKTEFNRILKPGGNVFLIWNKKIPSEGFMNDYFGLLEKYGTDYNKVKHENFDSHVIGEFFYPHEYSLIKMKNEQVLDKDGIKGRLLSSSYIPVEGEHYRRMIEELEINFEKYNSEGTVRIDYETLIYAGKLR